MTKMSTNYYPELELPRCTNCGNDLGRSLQNWIMGCCSQVCVSALLSNRISWDFILNKAINRIDPFWIQKGSKTMQCPTCPTALYSAREWIIGCCNRRSCEQQRQIRNMQLESKNSSALDEAYVRIRPFWAGTD